MKKELINEKLQSRHEFFKKVARAALLVVGTVVLANISIPVKAQTYGQQGQTYGQQEQIVQARYASGRSLLIKVSGGYIVAVCQSRDSQGHQIWDYIQPAKIEKNLHPELGSDLTRNMTVSSFKYTARIGGGWIYFDF